MIKRVGDKVEITINSEELIKSIALLQDLKEFCEKHQNEESAAPTIEAMTVAIEVMMAFYCEKFPEEGDEGDLQKLHPLQTYLQRRVLRADQKEGKAGVNL